MPEEEKTTVEEKTVEEEKAEVEETEVEEKNVEETKTEPVKEAPDAKEETKPGEGDGTRTEPEPPTYDEVMDFIERHNLPKGLALGESMTIVMDTYNEGSKDSTTRFIVFGMGQTTDADFGKDGPAAWSDEFARALHVGDVATGVECYQFFGKHPEKGVTSLSNSMGGLFSTDCITYFGLMACLCAMEKEASDDGGGRSTRTQPSTDKESTFTVSAVGCSMPSRDKQCFHLGMVADKWGGK